MASFEHPLDYARAVDYWRGVTTPILFHGEKPGTGKTWLAHAIARELGKAAFQMQAHENTDEREILNPTFNLVPKDPAHPEGPKEGCVQFVGGPVYKAATAEPNGGVLIIDEFDLLLGTPFAGIFYKLGDSPSLRRIPLQNGTELIPKAGFMLIATMNASPEELPPAIRSRFRHTLEFDRPHPEAIGALHANVRKFCTAQYTDWENRVSDCPYRDLETMTEDLNRGWTMEQSAFGIWGERAESIALAIQQANDTPE